MAKRLARIVALVEIEAASDSDAMTIAGNLARQISGAIPTQYDVRGVEVEGVSEVDGDFTATTSTATQTDDTQPATNTDGSTTPTKESSGSTSTKTSTKS